MRPYCLSRSVLWACVAALREQTAHLCEEMLHSINTSQTGVHQKTLNWLVNFIDQFKQMNFASDTVMERQLEQVRKELLTRMAEQYRDNDYAKSQLVKGLNNLSNVGMKKSAPWFEPLATTQNLPFHYHQKTGPPAQLASVRGIISLNLRHSACPSNIPRFPPAGSRPLR